MVKRTLRSILRRVRSLMGKGPAARGPSSANYLVVTRDEALALRLDGWAAPDVAERQDAAFGRVLDAMRAGSVRQDLRAAADAVAATGIDQPEILEVGCGSGYYSEILPYLLGRPVRYTGSDYSEAMVALAGARYPGVPFVRADATGLPFADKSFDIVFNGAALMHIARFEQAIAESARVARSWCIFHTVTVHHSRPTVYLRKTAYGAPTVELSFNRDALVAAFAASGLEVHTEFAGIAYDLASVIGEPTVVKTFLCRLRD